MSEEATYVGADEEYAPFWDPEPGATIKGVLEDVHVMQGKYGPTPVVTLKLVDGERLAVLVKGTVFREEMAERHPKVGDDLEIKYLGTKAPRDGGTPYHVYRVLGGQEPEFNWGQFVDPNRRESASSDPPIAPSPAFAGVSAAPASSAPADADMGPLPSRPPAPQGEQFGDEPPF